MAKRKHKHVPKQQQKQIAVEVDQHQEHLKLKQQLSTMKRLPKDFRDITLGTDWKLLLLLQDDVKR